MRRVLFLAAAGAALLAFAPSASATTYFKASVGTRFGAGGGTCSPATGFVEGPGPQTISTGCGGPYGSAGGAATASFGHLGAGTTVASISAASVGVDLSAQGVFRDDSVIFTSSDPLATFADVQVNLLLDGALATTATEELLGLPMLAPDQVTDPLHAYQLAKRGNSLRVMAEAVRWGKRGARVNTISPGIIFTPLAKDELTGPRGEGYRRMIELSPVGRGGTPDEVGAVGALLMGPDGTFITGSDFLMDGGVTASYFYGELAPR